MTKPSKTTPPNDSAKLTTPDPTPPVVNRRFAIHPGVGIARLGDSPDEFFIGPETPDWRPVPAGGYKDALGRVKRQAAKFRVFEIGEDGTPIREVTGPDYTVTWTVHLANKKAAWYRFVGKYVWADPTKRKSRNPSIQPDVEADARTDLIIDPGPRTIVGAVAESARFDTGCFLGKPVDLGEIRTDEVGRLIVLGGHGHSESVRPNNPVLDYANNDYWHDDTADGPVRATVTLADGTTVEADSAWVVVAPPKFAPQIDNMVTLNDVVLEVSEQAGWISSNSGTEFYRDVYPVLQSASDYSWVSAMSYRGHGAGVPGAFTEPSLVAVFKDPSDASGPARNELLKRLRMPIALAPVEVAARQANFRYMPLLYGDGGEGIEGDPTTWLSVLPGQYRRLSEWAAGKFTVASPPPVTPLEMLPVAEQPGALDRGALQPCAGGPFYPGIEMTFISLEPDTWRAPYRVNAEWVAGDITKWMAVPWQADFFECMFHWWPAQRPDDVLPEEEYTKLLSTWDAAAPPDQPTGSPFAAAAAARVPWARGLPTVAPDGDNAMVRYWNELGFVVKEKMPSGEVVHVERQRTPGAGMDVRDLFFKLMNIDSFPEILPKAKSYVESCLAEARAYQNGPDTPDMWQPIRYSKVTFDAKIMETYRSYLVDVETYDPATDPLFTTRARVIERIRQFAPFNMSDGSWLRNITRVGPIDESRALLFSVLMDEMGDGEVSHNHSNLYRDLCHTIGFYPSDCTSPDFAYNADFLDSAFDVPAFELAISLFSDTWYPELLGMTLQLELGILEAKTTIALMEYFGFDAKYWIMHVGIDNPVNGHAARAKRAIELYLDNVRANGGGDEAVQAQWQRIWDGYVAFGTTGTFGQDFADALTKPPTFTEQVQAMIKSKAAFGSMNHDNHELAGTPINELFLNPPVFMQRLLDAGYFLPGDPDNSPFFRLTSFENGRMYRVFTDDELELWANWCRALASPPTSPQPSDPYVDMVRVVQTLRDRQAATPGHSAAMLESPTDGSTHSVAWWFLQPTRDFLDALRSPKNNMIVPGHPDTSAFVTELLAPNGPMGTAFSDPVPGLGKRTGREVTIGWIAAGCPVPPSPQTPGLRPLWLATTVSTTERHHVGRRRGMGAVH